MGGQHKYSPLRPQRANPLRHRRHRVDHPRDGGDHELHARQLLQLLHLRPRSERAMFAVRPVSARSVREVCISLERGQVLPKTLSVLSVIRGSFGGLEGRPEMAVCSRKNM